ncbi:hypothetical protein B0J11DRAFT_266294 [Dendryphion nanum]|uniref:Uncharacterized protein n=1 Tax=Dendryphion nanum TaxID=256645 RepID=A0A9P9DZT4_9PLEO|nr:hypothetical protein B0J11DRAFT_266294 [Dendryphion nanum]
MSDNPSREPSPSNTNKNLSSQDTTVIPEASNQQRSVSDDRPNLVESPQPTAESRSQSTSDLLSQVQATSSTTTPPAFAPLIVITGSPQPTDTSARQETTEAATRQGRPLVSRSRTGHSSSQPPRRSTTPYSRPRARSQPRGSRTIPTSTMSSASSSPGNTSTSGPSTSGSGQGYQLPYAPFPYPMPRGGQGQSGNSGK